MHGKSLQDVAKIKKLPCWKFKFEWSSRYSTTAYALDIHFTRDSILSFSNTQCLWLQCYGNFSFEAKGIKGGELLGPLLLRILQGLVQDLSQWRPCFVFFVYFFWGQLQLFTFCTIVWSLLTSPYQTSLLQTQTL